MACSLGKEHVCCTRIENLSVKVGNEYILKDLNFHLHCGELTAVVGRNGAGKSTFMKALLNVIPHSGQIIFESERCLTNCSHEHINYPPKICSNKENHIFTTKNPRFGYVPQSLSVEAGNPISVEDLVLACTSKRPVWFWKRKKDSQKVHNILCTTNAQSLAKKCVCDLSGGELQRVMLALAINPLPDILLLDEPVSGVDRVGLKKFYELVSSLRRDYDITILLVSHDLDLVARHADKVIFINNQNAEIGNVEEIYHKKSFVDVFGHIMLHSEYEENDEDEDDETELGDEQHELSPVDEIAGEHAVDEIDREQNLSKINNADKVYGGQTLDESRKQKKINTRQKIEKISGQKNFATHQKSGETKKSK